MVLSLFDVSSGVLFVAIIAKKTIFIGMIKIKTMRYQHRNLFRLLLVVSLITITFLATTGQAIPILDSVWDKAKHFVAFLVLAGLSDFSFPERRFDFFNLLLLVAYGLLIEVIQWYLPYRYFSLLDLVADALGGFCYLSMATALLPIKSRLCAG